MQMLAAWQTPAAQVPPPVQATKSSERPSAAQTERVRLSKQELVPGAQIWASHAAPAALAEQTVPVGQGLRSKAEPSARQRSRLLPSQAEAKGLQICGTMATQAPAWQRCPPGQSMSVSQPTMQLPEARSQRWPGSQSAFWSQTKRQAPSTQLSAAAQSVAVTQPTQMRASGSQTERSPVQGSVGPQASRHCPPLQTWPPRQSRSPVQPTVVSGAVSAAVSAAVSVVELSAVVSAGSASLPLSVWSTPVSVSTWSGVVEAVRPREATSVPQAAATEANATNRAKERR